MDFKTDINKWPLNVHSKTLIEKYYNTFMANNKLRYEVKYYHTTLGHDGYDCHGPESNLWDLEVIYIDNNDNDNKLYRDWWHAENWFHPGKEEQFELYKTLIFDINDMNGKNKALGYTYSEKTVEHLKNIIGKKIIIDAANMLNADEFIQEGFKYAGIGTGYSF